MAVRLPHQMRTKLPDLRQLLWGSPPRPTLTVCHVVADNIRHLSANPSWACKGSVWSTAMHCERCFEKTDLGMLGVRSYSTQVDPFFEMRTYTVKPHLLNHYLEITNGYAGLRKDLNPGWLGFWTIETGGVLNEVKHLYYFKGGWPQRDEIRSTLASNAPWTKEYLPTIRTMVDKQESVILAEASDCMRACGRPSAAHLSTVDSPGSSPVYELRTYELQAGYHAVPQLVKHFSAGLPDRVQAPGCGQCMFMGHSDVGRLNVFLELWRHSSTEDSLLARKGARTALKWRETIGAVAPLTVSFTNQLLRPTPFSPWK